MGLLSFVGRVGQATVRPGRRLRIRRIAVFRTVDAVPAFFQGVGADAPDEDLRRIAPLHPIFRISRHP
jgi:hypothetical protein